MKSLKIAGVALLCTQLSACLVFIPGSVVRKISDAATGSEGDNCVRDGTKVGDKVRLPTDEIATVASLSGTSTLCRDPRLPIRARVVIPKKDGAS